MKQVSIIDYGLSNLLSVQHAFEYFGVKTEIINSPNKVREADVLILPGVGAFKDGMDGLRKLNLISPIMEVAQNKTPILGICLGMQMLFDESEEYGINEGLKLIPGRVVRIPNTDIYGENQKIPHISWDPLLVAGNANGFEGTILNYIMENEECYFIHSYEAKPDNPENRIADTVYGGRRICAVVSNGNIHGTQFHPEKSGDVGLRIIKRFAELYCK